MFFDARKIDSSEPVQSDLCIIGAGPAGIVIADALRAKGISVVLLESGGSDFNASLEKLNEGEVVDPLHHGPLEEYRRRRLGGATTAWGGRCVPFDPIDFEQRSFVPDSGWPISLDELRPFYERAHGYLDLGQFDYDPARLLPDPECDREMIPGLRAEEIATDSVYLFSPPTNFGRKYREPLSHAPDVRVYLFATATRLATDSTGKHVTAVDAIAPGGRKFTVVAKKFVLAAGGLEVVRLLLLSNDVCLRGLGNDHDLLGRYYMCHAVHHVELEFRDPAVIWDYERTRQNVWCQRTLRITDDHQRRHGLLNHRARIEHPNIADPAHRDGVLSAMYLAKAILGSPIVRRRFSDRANVLSRGTLPAAPPGIPRSRLYLRHGTNVIRGGGTVLRMANRWLFDRVLSARRLPSMVMKSLSNVYTLRIDAEQAPNRDSRVTLSDQRDALGQRRLKVDWRCTDVDMRSLDLTSRLLGDAVARSGAGRVRSVPQLNVQATGGHHLGTTRMSADPARGVVNRDCKLHSVDNLYVASGSVFPTSSYANPTLTIVAMALRLADHLSRS